LLLIVEFQAVNLRPAAIRARAEHVTFVQPVKAVVRSAADDGVRVKGEIDEVLAEEPDR
jgi:hypothetical protein